MWNTNPPAMPGANIGFTGAQVVYFVIANPLFHARRGAHEKV